MVSVKTLAEFVHRRGDLYPQLGGRVTGEEGIACQRRVQQGRGAGYEREVAVRFESCSSAVPMVVSGRVDGMDLSTSPPLVEEIKTTRAPAAEAESKVGSAHWAQARLYAALLSSAHPEVAQWTIRLLYCHPDTGEAVPFEETKDRDQLKDYLEATLSRYGRWLAAQLGYRTDRDRWLQARPFPYGSFRPHQRALAGRVYRAFTDAEHLLLEAPTGSGKTMGVLYPALKALAEGRVARLFYLTSRGTGSLAALKACGDLAAEDRSLRVVELIAKEKACPVEGMPCDESCPNAVGYYDRIQPALAALLERGQMDRAAVQAVAAEHRVCPFELSLDAALWADVTIGDYNYLIDPVVRLQRFAEDASLGLLIDESHQLAERTRDMLSLALSRSDVQRALDEAPPGHLGTRLRGLDRVLMTLRRDAGNTGTTQGQTPRNWRGEAEAIEIPRPEALFRAISRVMETLAEEALDLAPLPACQQLMFSLSRWSRAEAWLEETPSKAAEDVAGKGASTSAPFRFYLASSTPKGGKKEVVLRLACLDPSTYLRRTLAGYGPHVRFSGTVTPLSLYQTQHGQADAPAERVESPFAAEQQTTLLVGDLPVYYRNRLDSLPRLAELVRGVAAAKPGNYLVALPSFEYLKHLQEALSTDAGSSEALVLAQTAGSSDAEREAFLAALVDDGLTRIALVVLGGVFAESVDFAHGTIAGVICVGVGLPPGSPIRDAMREHFDVTVGPGQGEVVAFQQPAMVKVLQMAGRLLRGPEDRGVLVLVDDRFGRPAFQQFFPGHWQPAMTRAKDVPQVLENFWQGATPLPRLRTS